jgi:hypothetical protein
MEDEDEQLRRAIELSLQGASSPNPVGRAPVLEEDEELAQAIQLSLLAASQSNTSQLNSPKPGDACNRGTIFVLNEIRGMKGDANANCTTIRQIVQPVRTCPLIMDHRLLLKLPLLGGAGVPGCGLAHLLH